eukprot:755794-Hanusia_phi.AAC.3
MSEGSSENALLQVWRKKSTSGNRIRKVRDRDPCSEREGRVHEGRHVTPCQGYENKSENEHEKQSRNAKFWRSLGLASRKWMGDGRSS